MSDVNLWLWTFLGFVFVMICVYAVLWIRIEVEWRRIERTHSERGQ